MLSLITTLLKEQEDSFLQEALKQIHKLKILSKAEILSRLMPPGQTMTRDSLALSQGRQIPPHFQIHFEIINLKEPFTTCKELAQLARNVGSHCERQIKQIKGSQEIGTHVFIGHGNSKIWRELKDFLQDRLQLPWDEFNRIPIAGITNIARLSEMLNSATIAFLIMTGEDEQVDGKINARLNVIHEAGLFQGHLGFTRAIVLLEEGCEEFSNIQGLGQIRFPKGNIKAVFEDIRQILEREKIVKP
jgi:predicted nucleotide-binding protein